MNSNSPTKGIGVFLALTALLSLPFWIIASVTGEFALPLLLAPMVAAMITRYIFQRNVRNLGWEMMKSDLHPRWWGWSNTRYLALGWALPPLIAIIVYGVTWIAVADSFSNEDSAVDVLVSFLSVGTGLVLFLSVMAIGEEVGWRGFLFPELLKKTNFFNASVIGGVVWGLWHFPLIIFAPEVFDFGELPLIFALPMFTLIFIPVTAVLGWLQMKTGSVWPAVIAHGSHNALTLSFFNDLTSQDGAAPYIAGEVGVGLLVAWAIVAFILLRRSPLAIQISPRTEQS
ncbi:MAG: CPBP family intramembrane metalloprotease [Chloroflexi bacterium]|nr:CPBP family intramembrane metalloprotease [Chloroflexota bacterium]